MYKEQISLLKNIPDTPLDLAYVKYPPNKIKKVLFGKQVYNLMV